VGTVLGDAMGVVRVEARIDGRGLCSGDKRDCPIEGSTAGEAILSDLDLVVLGGGVFLRFLLKIEKGVGSAGSGLGDSSVLLNKEDQYNTMTYQRDNQSEATHTYAYLAF
jgi:hypothetical protein